MGGGDPAIAELRLPGPPLLSLADGGRSTILDIVNDVFDNDLGELSYKLPKPGIFCFQRLDVRFLNVPSEWLRLDLSAANSAFWESFSHRPNPLYFY